MGVNMFREGDWKSFDQPQSKYRIKAGKGDNCSFRFYQIVYSCFENWSVAALKVNTVMLWGVMASLNHIRGNPHVCFINPTTS